MNSKLIVLVSLLALAAFIFTAPVSVLNGHKPTTVIASPFVVGVQHGDALSIAADPVDNDTSGTASALDDVTDTVPLLWEGGSVEGKPESDAIRVLQELFVEYLPHRHKIKDALCTPSEERIAQLRDVTLKLTEQIATLDDAIVDDDCRYRIAPHHRAVCILTAMSDDERDEVPLFQREAFRRTLCAHIAACLDWSRGRFPLQLNMSLLSDVLHHRVLPRLDRSRTSVSTYARQFVHSSRNAHERPWLGHRTHAMHNDMEKRRRQFRLLEPLVASRKGKSRGKSAEVIANSSSLYAPSSIRAIFQGERIGFCGHVSTNPLWSSFCISGRRAPYLSSLQFLAMLVDTIGPALDGDHLNVMIINGDSVDREIFHRLVHWVRYGPSAKHHAAHFHYASHYDMVYAVHPTHDELLAFHSKQTVESSTYTVDWFFRDVRRRVSAWRDAAGSGPPPVALLYVVFYWDPYSRWPRAGSYGVSDKPFYVDAMKPEEPLRSSENERGLSELGVHVSVLVHGNAFWERVQLPEVLESIEKMVLHRAAHSTNRTQQLYFVLPIIEDLLSASYPERLPLRDGSTPLDYDVSATPKKVPPGHMTAHANLYKSLSLFSWLQNIAAKAATHRTVSTSANRDEYFLLDKAKAQFIGEPLRDKIHFTCRAPFVNGKHIGLKQSVAKRPLARLLGHSTPAPATIQHWQAVEGTSDAKSFADANSTGEQLWCGRSLRILDVVAVWHAVFAPADVQTRLRRAMFFERTAVVKEHSGGGLFIPRGSIAAGWRQGRIPQIEGLGDDTNASAPQMYASVDSVRSDCEDEGDLVVLHSLLFDTFMRRRR